MRITFLSHTGGRGGSTTLLNQLESWFRCAGCTTTVLLGDEIPSGSRLTHRRGLNWRSRIETYRAEIEKTQPSVVYSISGKDEFDVLRFLSFPRVRHVSSLEQHDYVDMPLWLSQLSPFVDGFTANTPDVLGQLRLHSPSGFRGWVAPYQLQTPIMRDVNLTRVNQPTEICFIGRFEKQQKRVDWLPEIISRCQSSGGNLHWHLYGDGPEGAALRHQIEALQLDDLVTFEGWVNASSLYARLPNHDIFFLCSAWEGLPIAMVEAMLAGLACVVPADRAGMSYMLAEGGGWLYRATSPAGAAEALLSAVSDSNTLGRKRQEAQLLARRHFDPHLINDQLSELFVGLRELKRHRPCAMLSNAPQLRSVTAVVKIRRRMRRLLKLLQPQ